MIVVLLSHKHTVYVKTIELVIDTLIKRRELFFKGALQIPNKFSQFHIAYA